MHSIHQIEDNKVVIRLDDWKPQVDWFIDRYDNSPWTYWGDQYDTAMDEYRIAKGEMFDELMAIIEKHGRVNVYPRNIPIRLRSMEYLVITLGEHSEYRVEYYAIDGIRPMKYDECTVRDIWRDIELPDMYSEILVEWYEGE